MIGLLMALTYSSSMTMSISAWAATLFMPSMAMAVGLFWMALTSIPCVMTAMTVGFFWTLYLQTPVSSRR